LLSNENTQFEGPDMLSRLIAFDADSRALWPARALTQALDQQLKMRLDTLTVMVPPDERIGMVMLLEECGPDLQTFADLLWHPRPPLELLRACKEFAKRAKHSRHSTVPPEIALLVYYGSIVAGLLRLGRRITTLGDEDLRQGINWVVRQQWVDPLIRQLFRDALAHLRVGRHLWRI
jgi:hypothetical protein